MPFYQKNITQNCFIQALMKHSDFMMVTVQVDTMVLCSDHYLQDPEHCSHQSGQICSFSSRGSVQIVLPSLPLQVKNSLICLAVCLFCLRDVFQLDAWLPVTRFAGSDLCCHASLWAWHHGARDLSFFLFGNSDLF